MAARNGEHFGTIRGFRPGTVGSMAASMHQLQQEHEKLVLACNKAITQNMQTVHARCDSLQRSTDSLIAGMARLEAMTFPQRVWWMLTGRWPR